MPLYFFNLDDQDQDRIGTEFASDEAARVAAIQFVGELLRYEPERLRGEQRCVIEVVSADTVPLFRVVAQAV